MSTSKFAFFKTFLLNLQSIRKMYVNSYKEKRTVIIYLLIFQKITDVLFNFKIFQNVDFTFVEKFLVKNVLNWKQNKNEAFSEAKFWAVEHKKFLRIFFQIGK